MVDFLFTAYSSFKTKPLDPKFKPHQAIRSQELFNQKSDRLVVIFPWWHAGSGFFYKSLVRRLKREGWAVLAYHFDSQILQADEELVMKSFEFIQKQVTAELNLLKRKHGYKQIEFLGLSLGNISLCLVADKFQDFSGATIVAGGDDLAKDMWYGIATKEIRKDFTQENVRIQRLDLDWLPLAPDTHVRSFANKKVDIIMALKDRMIFPQYQKRLANDISKVTDQVTIKKFWVGHTVTVAYYCLAGPKI